MTDSGAPGQKSALRGSPDSHEIVPLGDPLRLHLSSAVGSPGLGHPHLSAEQLQELSHCLPPPILGPISIRVTFPSSHQHDPSKKSRIRTSRSQAQNLRGSSDAVPGRLCGSFLQGPSRPLPDLPSHRPSPPSLSPHPERPSTPHSPGLSLSEPSTCCSLLLECSSTLWAPSCFPPDFCPFIHCRSPRLGSAPCSLLCERARNKAWPRAGSQETETLAGQ